MPRRRMAFKKKVLNELLAGPNGKDVSGKLVIQKALAERMLNAEVIWQLNLECFQIPKQLFVAFS